MAYTCWKDAVHAELDALVRNNAWSFCPLPPHRRTIGCKWLFKVIKGWPLRQVDVNNTFLNGELTEEIFMDQPPGLEVLGPNGQKLVCKLNKALYGQCQAPRTWFHTLKHFLVSKLGFHASKVDQSLFIRTSGDSQLLFMAYVSDIVIIGSSSQDIDSVVLQLHNKFALKDMAWLNFFLGIEVQSTPQGLFLN